MVLEAGGGGLRDGMPLAPGLLPSSSSGTAVVVGRLNSDAADSEGLFRLSPGARATGPEAAG